MSVNQKTHEWFLKQNLLSHFYPEITSTNDAAKSEFKNLNSDFAIYLADHQTAGRGRNNSHWQNLAAGEVLLSTWCFRLNKSPQPTLTPLVGLALYNSLLKDSANGTLHIKPPNDLMVDGHKLSGFLVEVSQQANDIEVFVGLGLNVFASPEVDQPTTFLEKYWGQIDDNWPEFLGHFLTSLQKAIPQGTEKELATDKHLAIRKAVAAGGKEWEKLWE